MAERLAATVAAHKDNQVHLNAESTAAEDQAAATEGELETKVVAQTQAAKEATAPLRDVPGSGFERQGSEGDARPRAEQPRPAPEEHTANTEANRLRTRAKELESELAEVRRQAMVKSGQQAFAAAPLTSIVTASKDTGDTKVPLPDAPSIATASSGDCRKLALQGSRPVRGQIAARPANSEGACTQQ
jgi:hypothetical protein